VEARGRSFHVAGRYIGEAKTHSQDGQPAPRGPVGLIPPGHYFLYTPHKDSLDSRYSMIGWVPQRQILGVAKGIM
jgi:conjugal transfer pilin signal peptidase TrbI